MDNSENPLCKYSFLSPLKKQKQKQTRNLCAIGILEKEKGKVDLLKIRSFCDMYHKDF